MEGRIRGILRKEGRTKVSNSQFQIARLFGPITVDCLSTLVIKRKYTTYITSALFAHTGRLKTDTLFFIIRRRER